MIQSPLGYDTNMRRRGNENFSSKKGMAYDGWEKKSYSLLRFEAFFFLLIRFPHKPKGGGRNVDAIHSLESSLVSVYKLLELVLFKENELIQIYNESALIFSIEVLSVV